MPPPPHSRWLPLRGTRALALGPGLALVALLATIDIVAQPATAVIGMVLVAPLLTVLLGTARDVLLVAAIAIAVVLASGIWHENFGSSVYFYRVAIVTAVIGLAAFVARGRSQVSRDRERFALLAAVAEIADGTLTLTDTVERLNKLARPQPRRHLHRRRHEPGRAAAPGGAGGG